MSNNLHKLVTFSSSLGWMALTWGSRGIRRMTLGHDDPHGAVTRLLNSAAKDGDVDIVDTVSVEIRSVIKRLQRYCDGADDMLLDVQLDNEGDPPFTCAVRDRCREIPRGTTVSYSELAARAGSPRAARAVGNVMRNNRVPLIVPCHRVVAANSLGGYSAPRGLELKVSLLRLEGWHEDEQHAESYH